MAEERWVVSKGKMGGWGVGGVGGVLEKRGCVGKREEK
jgi:hypothetical protein